MRDYAIVSPKFWNGETGRKIRAKGREEILLALYLMTSPHSNMIGLYYLPIPTLCHETGSPLKGALKALRSLREVGFAYYDESREEVWIPEMAKHQVAESLKPNDNRVSAIRKQLNEYRKSMFWRQFVEKYGEVFSLFSHDEIKALPSPFEGPSEPLRSQDQDQDQDQNKNIVELGKPKAKGNGWSGEVQEIFSYWQQVRGHPKAILTEERSKKIRERLDAGFTAERIKAAIRGVQFSAYHMGKNESGTVYDDIFTICKNGKNVDTFADLDEKARARAAPRPKILDEPEETLTEEQRQENLKRARELTAAICGRDQNQTGSERGVR